MKKFFALMFVCVLVACAGTAQAEPYSALLQWSPPTERENGQPITVDELGGYEIQVTLDGDTEHKTIVVPDGRATSYRISELPPGTHTFRIAVFDVSGLYSEFVPITHAQAGPPSAPAGVSVNPIGHDVIAACLADPRCRVAVAGEW